MGEAAGGGVGEQAGSMVFLPPSSSGVVGSRVGGGPGGGGQTQPELCVALLASLDNDLLCPPPTCYQGHSCAQGPAFVAGLRGVCISNAGGHCMYTRASGAGLGQDCHLRDRWLRTA